jgi:steroid 5-alpha reductase family enzyme
VYAVKPSQVLLLDRRLKQTSYNFRLAPHFVPLQPLSGLAIAGIVALKALGYLVFRGANSQKDLFRRNPGHPRVASLRTLPTERGTKLIVSGWWGIARHINYTGDWMMG